MDRRAARCIGLLVQHAGSPCTASLLGDVVPRHLFHSLARSQGALPASRSGPLQEFMRASKQTVVRRVVRGSSAMPARQEAGSTGPEFRMQGKPSISIGLDGAISMVCDDSVVAAPTVFENKDGHRVEDGRYAAFAAEISTFIPEGRQFTDPVRTFAYGTDASFYRLNPKLVVKVRSSASPHTLFSPFFSHRTGLGVATPGSFCHTPKPMNTAVRLGIRGTASAAPQHPVHVR